MLTIYSGNFSNGSNNNIFGTRWLSDIFIMTNSRNIAQFTSGNTLTSFNGNSGDGLRIRNLATFPSAGNLDLFTSNNNGGNETHIVWGSSGQISGQANRFEQYANGQGFWFDAAQAGTFKFARSGAVTAFVGTNDFWRIGKQLDAQNFNANRRLEVVDNFIQFRLTYAAANTQGTQYTDFLSNSAGNLQILPVAGRVGINITSNPTEGIDVEGNARIRQLPLFANQAALTENKVVMVDATGVLKWRDASAFGGVSTASNAAWINPANDDVEWGTNPLTHNTQIPMANSNVAFTSFPGSPSNTNNVKIGGNAIPVPVKLSVLNDVESIGVKVVSNSPVFGGTNRYGVFASSQNSSISTGIAGFGSDGIQTIGMMGASSNASMTSIGLLGIASDGGFLTMGVRGFASSTNPNSLIFGSDFIAYGLSNFQNVGVRGDANGSVKQNIGGMFRAGNTGTLAIGVYGESPDPMTYTGFGPAGYFVGGLVSTGGTFWIGSDSTLKQNIAPISDNTDSLLMAVETVRFDYLQSGQAARLHLPEGVRYGVLAQQVEPLFPSIVKTATHPAEYDSLGLEIAPSFQYKVVDVSQLVPIMLSDLQKKTSIISNQSSQIGVLTNSVDSMNTVVSNLNDRLTQLENCLSGILPFLCQLNNSAIQPTQEIVQEQLRAAIKVNLSDRNAIVLRQNVPNPFAESTTITFSIPASVQKAQIHFYDGQGKLINSVDIVERGNGQINVFANDLSTGVYTYSLVADGQIVSTKRMVKE